MLDRNVSCELCAVGDHNVISHLAIMTEVGEGHDEIVVTKTRCTAALGRAEADADVFTYSIFVADHQFALAFGEAIILGRPAEHRTALDQVLCPDPNPAVSTADPGMGFHGRVGTDNHAAFDDAVRPDLGTRRDFGIGGYDGSGVNAQAELSLVFGQPALNQSPSQLGQRPERQRCRQATGA